MKQMMILLLLIKTRQQINVPHTMTQYVIPHHHMHVHCAIVVCQLCWKCGGSLLFVWVLIRWYLGQAFCAHFRWGYSHLHRCDKQLMISFLCLCSLLHQVQRALAGPIAVVVEQGLCPAVASWIFVSAVIHYWTHHVWKRIVLWIENTTHHQIQSSYRMLKRFPFFMSLYWSLYGGNLFGVFTMLVVLIIIR